MEFKHPLDWYNENTPLKDEEYEKDVYLSP